MGFNDYHCFLDEYNVFMHVEINYLWSNHVIKSDNSEKRCRNGTPSTHPNISQDQRFKNFLSWPDPRKSVSVSFNLL